MPLLGTQLKQAVAGVARTLDAMHIDYALMGGAAVFLLDPSQPRATEDVDLVIHADSRQITGDRLTSELTTRYADEFTPISQYGHTIPAYRLNDESNDDEPILVQLEIFDAQTWPQRP
jgi:hypothetical protein